MRAFDCYRQWPWLTWSGVTTADARCLCGSWASWPLTWLNSNLRSFHALLKDFISHYVPNGLLPHPLGWVPELSNCILYLCLSSFFHPRSGIVMFLVASVCISICNTIITFESLCIKFIFGMRVRLQGTGIRVKFVYEGHRVRVKVIGSHERN